MSKYVEGWKSMRKSAQILLVISTIVGIVLGISFILTVTTSGETSRSPQVVNTINNVFAGSLIAAAICFIGFLVDTQYKHASKKNS